MWYNNKILKDIIMSRCTRYVDVEIRSITTNTVPDMVTVNFRYKSETYKTVDNFCRFLITINVHKRDIRDYRISKILN